MGYSMNKQQIAEEQKAFLRAYLLADIKELSDVNYQKREWYIHILLALKID